MNKYLHFLYLNRTALLLIVFCLPLFVACGGGGGGAKVTGTITIDGQPAETGAISFFPVNGQGPTAGTKIKGGKYECNVVPGKSKVEIRVPKVVGQRKLYPTPDSPVKDVTAEVLPTKYNDQSELELDITSGTNEKNWELLTK